MTNAIKIVIAAICLATACTPAPSDPVEMSASEGGERFVNGLWYEYGKFVKGDKFVKDGVFVEPSDKIFETIDLGGAYVLPPFAEAHHHTVLCDEERIGQFTKAGIFYVQILNARISQKKCEREMHNQIGAPEVTNAYAGLTATAAHPSQIGEYFLEPEEIDGEWVHIVDTSLDIDSKWGAIRAMDADILKIFLSYTEEYEFLRDADSISRFYKGLDPQLVGPISAMAHRENMRMAAHVMSAHDFHVAVEAGVDQIAHMPGFAPGPGLTMEFGNEWLVALMDDPARYLISRADAETAARKDVKVITTLSGMDEILGDPAAFISEIESDPASQAQIKPDYDRWIELWRHAARHNMRVLKDAGVEILIGSDRGEFNSVDEAVFLVDQDLLTSAEAIASLSVATPRAIFPKRRIGSFEPGAEASFLVTTEDPLDDINTLREIERMYKKGVQMN